MPKDASRLARALAGSETGIGEPPLFVGFAFASGTATSGDKLLELAKSALSRTSLEQPLVALPDLSEMIMKAAASEVDAGAIASGQDAAVSVDALPDRSYRARVTGKGTLARRRERDSRINVFDVELVLLDKDPELKPGSE